MWMDPSWMCFRRTCLVVRRRWRAPLLARRTLQRMRARNYGREWKTKQWRVRAISAISERSARGSSKMSRRSVKRSRALDIAKYRGSATAYQNSLMVTPPAGKFASLITGVIGILIAGANAHVDQVASQKRRVSSNIDTLNIYTSEVDLAIFTYNTKSSIPYGTQRAISSPLFGSPAGVRRLPPGRAGSRTRLRRVRRQASRGHTYGPPPRSCTAALGIAGAHPRRIHHFGPHGAFRRRRCRAPGAEASVDVCRRHGVGHRDFETER